MNTPPRTCPTCGEGLSEHPYYQTIPGRAGKLVRKVGIWLLPIMAAVYFYVLFWGDVPMGFGTGAGYFAILVICGPSLLLYMVSLLLPKARRVMCLHCSWNQEYPNK